MLNNPYDVDVDAAGSRSGSEDEQDRFYRHRLIRRRSQSSIAYTWQRRRLRNCFIGTSGYSYPNWRVVYPKTIKRDVGGSTREQPISPVRLRIAQHDAALGRNQSV